MRAQKLRSGRGPDRALPAQTPRATSITARPARSAKAVRAGLDPWAARHTTAKARVIPAAARNQRCRRTRPILVILWKLITEAEDRWEWWGLLWSYQRPGQGSDVSA